MTLVLPTLDPAVPVTLRSGATDPGHVTLAYALANGGLMAPADLRVGSGGLRRMVERVFARWWADAGLPARLTSPLQFRVITDADRYGVPEAREGEPWLLLESWTQMRRYYLRDLYGHWHARQPREAAHALAVLYRALDTVSYSLTPPRFLDFARRYWWNGADDLAPGARKRTGFLTRRMFETRFAACTLAPAEQPHWALAAALQARRARTMRSPRALLNGHRRHPAPEVRAVEDALAAPRLLTRNARELTGRPVTDSPIILRWRYDDQHGRLIDHWQAEIDGIANIARDGLADHIARALLDARPGRTERRALFTGAWPLRNIVEIEDVRRALPATVRLIHATDQLLARLADSSAGGFYL